MSPIETHRLTAVSPSSATGTGARTLSGKTGPEAARQQPPASTPKGVSVELRGKVEASQPPVDSDRVAEIKSAIRDGSYPIVPTEIADAMIAARLMLGFGK